MSRSSINTLIKCLVCVVYSLFGSISAIKKGGILHYMCVCVCIYVYVCYVAMIDYNVLLGGMTDSISVNAVKSLRQ